MPKSRKEAEEALFGQWERQMGHGRRHLDRSAFELALQSFANALQMCDTNSSLHDLKYQVLGNIGWVNRLAGRYQIATKTLEDAIALADSLQGPPTMERAMINSELGTIYRLKGRHEEARAAFEQQYTLAKQKKDVFWGWKRVACRAIGNMGMANYQRALQLLEENPDDPNTRHKARERIRLAISQLEERIKIAEEIAEEADNRSHGGGSQAYQARSWQSIALARLSLCYTSLANLDPETRDHNFRLALAKAKEGVEIATDNSALPLSRFFYGRALLLTAGADGYEKSKAKALKQFNSTSTKRDHPDRVITSAIALCMEPSAEHRGYLRELVDAGADLTIADPTTGYTALDYAVFAGDSESEAIVLDGLRRQCLSQGQDVATAQKLAHQQRQEARLRRGYREIFQEKLRPALQKGSERTYGVEDETALSRICHETVRDLRRVYAEALAADSETSKMFDHLKVIKYTDFAGFSKLPRSSDGLARPLEAMKDLSTGGEKRNKDNDEFVIFFSYRWINQDRTLDSPDDADRTQYKRMISAVEEYLSGAENNSVSRDNLFIWMDFACVNQDDPTSGVSALPLIIAQCDLVITLQDDTYYDRAWCCVEAMMINTLLRSYRIHDWLEHGPWQPPPPPPAEVDDDEYDGLTTTRRPRNYHRQRQPSAKDGKDASAAELIAAGQRPNPHWQLKSAQYIDQLKMADKKLSHESDRPKVLFLERQAEFLGRRYFGYSDRYD